MIYRSILILYHLKFSYDNILDKFEFERSKARVKVTVAILEKQHFHHSIALIYYPISVLLYSNIRYDNTWNKFAFQYDRVKVKVAATIFRNNFVTTLFMDLIYGPILILYKQVFNMIISLKSSSLSVLEPR